MQGICTIFFEIKESEVLAARLVELRSFCARIAQKLLLPEAQKSPANYYCGASFKK